MRNPRTVVVVAETLHRAVARRLGTTPDRYRQHFARRAS